MTGYLAILAGRRTGPRQVAALENDFHRLAFDQRLIVVEGLGDGTVDDVIIHMAIFTGNHLDGRDRAHTFGVDLRQVDAILDEGQERPVGTGDLTALGRGIDILPPALYKQDLARLL